MTTSAGAVQLDITANTTKFETQANAAAARVKGSWNKLAGVMGGALVFAGLGNFTSACIQAAGAAQQTANRVATVFPSMTDSVNAFASQAIEQMGMTAGTAKNLTARFGQMAQGMGLSEQQALGMSEQMTRLAGDMAAFYGVTTDDAMSTLRGVFTGMTRGFKQYGIVMSEDNLQAHALSLGIQQSVSSMSQAEMAALRLSYAQAQMANIQGYAQRNTQTWTGQTMMLTNQFAALKATLGQGMIAALLPLIKGLNLVLAAAIRAAQGFNALVEAVTGKKLSAAIGGAAGTAAALDDVVDDTALSTGGLADAQKDAAKAAKAQDKAQKALNRTLAGFDKINKLSSNKIGASVNPSSGGGSIGGGGGGVGGLGGFGDMFNVEDLEQKSQDAIKLPERLVASLQRLGEQLQRFGKIVSGALDWVWRNILKPLGEWTINEVAPRLVDILTDAFRMLNTVLETLAPAWDWIWQHLFKPLANFAGDAIITMLDGISGAFQMLADFAESHPKLFTGLVTALGGLFALKKPAATLVSALANGGLLGVLKRLKMTKFGEVLTKLFGIVRRNPVVAVVSAIVLAIGYLYKNWDKIRKTKVGQAIEKFGGKLKKLGEKLQPLIDKFNELKDKVMDKLGKAFEKVWPILEPILEALIEFFGDLIVASLEILIETLSALIDWISSVVDWLGENLPKAGETAMAIFEGIGKAWDAIKEGVKNLVVNAQEKVKGALDTLKEKWDGFKDKAAELLAEAKEKAKGALDTLKEKWDGIKTKAAELWADAKEKAKGALDTLKEKWDGIKTKVAELWTQAKEKVKGALKGLKEKWDGLKDKIATLTAKAVDKGKKIFENLKKTWKLLKTKLVKLTAKAIQKTKQVFENLKAAWKAIYDKTAELVGKAKNKLGTAWENIKDAWDNFKDKNAYLIAKAKDKVKDIARWWVERANEWKDKLAEFGIKIPGVDWVSNAWKELTKGWGNKEANFTVNTKKTTTAQVKSDWNARSKPWVKKGVNYTVNAGKTAVSSISNANRSRHNKWTGKGVNYTVSPTSASWVAWKNRQAHNKWTGKSVNYTINAKVGRNVGINLGGTVTRALSQLAQGGYVGRNQPRLAIIGDNTREGEIVSPESKFQTMLDKASQQGSSAEVISLLTQLLNAVNALDTSTYLDGMEISRAVVRNVNRQTQTTGRCPIMV